MRMLFAVLLAATAGCLDGNGPNAGTPPTLPGLVVSAPVQFSAVQGSAQASVAASFSTGVAYVSLVPGSVPDGRLATIRNLATTQSVTAVVVDGGFDPVAIAASVGDTLATEITRTGSAGPLRAVELVRPVRPPVVVRTSPPKGGHDVPLNAAIVVVFSEPIDSATLTTGSVQLSRDATPVAGTLRFADVAHLRVEFHPDSLLSPQTAYRLVATQAIRDVNGTALGSSLDVPFTTGTIGPATGLVFTSVSPGGYHACGLTSDGAAYCWGDNTVGQLGIGTTVSSAVPVPVAGGLTFSALSVGFIHNCGLTSGGAAYCWGEEDSIPAAVPGGYTFAVLSAGKYATICGLTPAGAAYCWGLGSGGQLGNGTRMTNATTPVPVAGGLTFAAVSVGFDFACGVTTSGTAYCWGADEFGQLGNGTTTDSPTPVAVAGGLTFKTVSAGMGHACGLTSTGAAYCWGDNEIGELGDGTTTGPQQCFGHGCSFVPVPVSGGYTFATISTGYLSSCGVTDAGAGYCWGWFLPPNTVEGGQPPSATPVAVGSGMTLATLRPGFNMLAILCGLNTVGTAYCWGDNLFGQLGDGTTTDSPVPVKVAGQP